MVINILSSTENIGMFGGESSWVFEISSLDAASIQSYHYGLSIDTVLNTNRHPSLISSPWSEIYTSGLTSDPYELLVGGWKIINSSGTWYISFSFYVAGPQFTNINDWTNFQWFPSTSPTPSSITPILLEWSNAFDVDNNISGYELSYRTTPTGSWIPLPIGIGFIASSQTSGSYSFTPTQQVTHYFRIRVRDSFAAVSTYKYFNYTITAEYQISSVYVNGEFGSVQACQITSEPTNTYSSIYLSTTPPDIGVVVSTNTTTYYGHNEYWLIKSPSELYYSCLIDDYGVIQEVYLCVTNSAQISLGRSTANATCLLTLTSTVYWESQYSFAVGTLLYTDPSCTVPFNGSQKYFLVEYTDSSGLTLTKVMKVGTGASFFTPSNPSVIVSIENKSTVCSTVLLSYRTSGTIALDGTSLCQDSPTTKCYIRLADPSIISTGDIVYTASGSSPGATFSGGNKYYNMYISLAAESSTTNAICKVDNFGVIQVQGFCSASAGGCCFLPGTSITLFDGSTINIEDIIGGESLLTYNTEKLAFEEGFVTNIFTPIHNDIIKLVIGNNTIDCTSTHPFWSVNKKEWVSLNPKETMLNMNINVEYLEIGDILLNEKNEEVILDNIIQIDTEDIVTYDISVEPNHTYYANTILVHNKLDANGDPITFNELNNIIGG